MNSNGTAARGARRSRGTGTGPAPRPPARRSPSRWRCGGRSSSSPSPSRRCTARRAPGPGRRRPAGRRATETGTARRCRCPRGPGRPAAGRVRIRVDGAAGAVRVEEDRQPAVGDLAGQVEVLRAERGQVDRDLGRTGCRASTSDFPGPSGSGRVKCVPPAVTRRRLSACRTICTYSPGAAERVGEPHAVPALGHLRPGDAQAQPEPAGGQRVQGGRGHRRHRRGASGDLQDAPNRCRSGGCGRRPRPARSPRPSRTPRPPRRMS